MIWERTWARSAGRPLAALSRTAMACFSAGVDLAQERADGLAGGRLDRARLAQVQRSPGGEERGEPVQRDQRQHRDQDEQKDPRADGPETQPHGSGLEL